MTLPLRQGRSIHKILQDASNSAAVALTTTLPLCTMDGDYRVDKFEVEVPGGYTADAANYYDISLQTAPKAITVNGSTSVITLAGHGFQIGDAVQFTAGVMPTGLSAGVTYYVIVLDVNTFKVATTPANAAAGTAVAISSAGTTPFVAKLMAIYSLLTGQQGSLTTLVFGTASKFANPYGLAGDQLNIVLTKFGTAANVGANSMFVAHLSQITGL